MKRLSSTLVGVEDGFVLLFDHFEVETEMWSGTGNRTVEKKVFFSESFEDAPSVTVAPTLIDAHNAAYLRLNLRVEEVAPDGFTIAADIWEDTRIARLGLRWQAIGALGDPEETWDV